MIVLHLATLFFHKKFNFNQKNRRKANEVQIPMNEEGWKKEKKS